MRHLLGFVLGCVVRTWVWTLRVHLDGLPLGDGPKVLAFRHGEQMPLLSIRGLLPLSVLVSLSRDGELQSGVMTALGLDVVRGSSSRGASAGLRGLVRAVRRGRSLALAVDGPRGPAGIAKPGAAFAAHAGRIPLFPVAAACSTKIVLEGTWDRFEIPLPFSRVAIFVGAEVPSRSALDGPESLSAGIASARERARELLSFGAARTAENRAVELV